MSFTTTLVWFLLAGQTAQIDTETSDRLNAERVIEAPAAAVWEAFTSREIMETWQVGRTDLGELRVGGTFRSSYDADSNLEDDSIIETAILAFDPGHMMATRVLRAPSDFPFPNAIRDVWSILYVAPVDENRTRVTVRMFGFTDSEESRQMRAFFDRGNPYELDQLARYFAAR